MPELEAICACWLVSVVLAWVTIHKLTSKSTIELKRIARSVPIALAFAPSLILGNVIGAAAPAPASLVLGLEFYSFVFERRSSDPKLNIEIASWSLLVTWMQIVFVGGVLGALQSIQKKQDEECRQVASNTPLNNKET